MPLYLVTIKAITIPIAQFILFTISDCLTIFPAISTEMDDDFHGRLLPRGRPNINKLADARDLKNETI